jgi:hypothetical protein
MINNYYTISKDTNYIAKDIFSLDHYWTNTINDSLIFASLDEAKYYYYKIFQNLISLEEAEKIGITFKKITNEDINLNQNKIKIGIDIGGVIIAKYNMGQDTSFFSENYLFSKAVNGAFETIKYLNKIFGAENIFLISKCGNKLKEKTLKWLEFNNFYKITGFLENNIYFCYDKESKVQICKNLKISHFIDDRDDVLWNMIGTVDHLLLFNPYFTSKYQDFCEPFKKMMGWRNIYYYFRNINSN